jgi:hypothetical protein
MYSIGAILLGIATLRAGLYAKLTGVFLIASGIGLLLTLPPLPPFLDAILESVSFIAFAGVFAWCGYTLMTHEPGTVERVPPAAVGAQASR